ncbi:MAG TPA: nucleotidyltransferase family protein [Verrucomicrobiota bacterium]|nr:nucleotidyltransferase family protein [Verrucomicrobiota bacterium]
MKAMLLCAGMGTRLGHLTRELPKPMLPIQDRPLLDFLLSHLRSQGIDDVVINLHFLPEIIQEYCGNGARWHLRITYSHEPTLLGTAGGLKKMEALFRQGETFLVQYGDILTDQDFSRMLQFHRAHAALATLLVHQRSRSNSIVCLDSEHRIHDFLERPTDEARRHVTSPWVNSGVCVCEPEILDHIPPGAFADLPRDVFVKLIPTGRLYGFPLEGYRCAIDSPERLEEAQKAVANGRCQISPLRLPD